MKNLLSSLFAVFTLLTLNACATNQASVVKADVTQAEIDTIIPSSKINNLSEEETAIFLAAYNKEIVQIQTLGATAKTKIQNTLSEIDALLAELNKLYEKEHADSIYEDFYVELRDLIFTEMTQLLQEFDKMPDYVNSENYEDYLNLLASDFFARETTKNAEKAAVLMDKASIKLKELVNQAKVHNPPQKEGSNGLKEEFSI